MRWCHLGANIHCCTLLVRDLTGKTFTHTLTFQGERAFCGDQAGSRGKHKWTEGLSIRQGSFPFSGNSLQAIPYTSSQNSESPPNLPKSVKAKPQQSDFHPPKSRAKNISQLHFSFVCLQWRCCSWLLLRLDESSGNRWSSMQATQATDIPQEEHLTCEAKAAALCFVCESVEQKPFRPYLGYQSSVG